VFENHQITLASTCYLSSREMELRELRQSLGSYAESAWPQELFLDCRHVQEAGAAFLGIVAESAGRFSYAGRSLRLINVNDWIGELLQHCRLNQVVALEKSRRERSAIEPMEDQCCVQRGSATCRS
jgi:anti-anti-sigma regulatory factor